MEIIKTKIEVQQLTPPEGMYLTQTTLERGATRTYSQKIFLGQETLESDWRLATAAEKETYDAQQELEVNIPVPQL